MSRMELRKYQRRARAFLVKRPRAILGDAPGVGKTPTTLSALQKAGAERALFIVPNSVALHWPAEASRWWPEVTMIDGRGPKARRAKRRTEAAAHPGPVGLVLNYESMRIDIDELLEVKWDSLVLDECHRAKNRVARQTVAAWKLAGRIPRVWLLSGSIIPNRPDEVWSLLHMLYPKLWPSYWRWVEEYMYTDRARFPGAGVYHRTVTGLRPGAVGAIRLQLRPLLLQRTLEELMPELPDLTKTVISVTLDAEERKAYDEVKKRHWTLLPGGELLHAVNAVARVTRLRQIIVDMADLGAERKEPGSKIKAVLELLADLDPEQAVVLTWTRAAAERIGVESGGVFIHGGVDHKGRDQALAAFKEGKARVLSGTLGVVGEGTDGLQVARHIILLDRPWTPAVEDQAIGRVRRSGQRDAVFAWIISAEKTVDQMVDRILDQKRSVIDAIRTGEVELDE